MSHCSKCNKEIFGDDIYEHNARVYCTRCAEGLSSKSMSAAPTGFGCMDSYIARKEYLRNENTTTCPVDWQEGNG
ncbi:MAG: hypothetical protein Q4C00_07515 [Bacillota bacterium]|nr:hypothetical protein [Bacillota bacterium]